MLKEPIDIVYSGLEREIGEPKDIHTLLEANGTVNFEQELLIPRSSETSAKNGGTAMVVDEIASKAVPSVATNGANHTNGKHTK